MLRILFCFNLIKDAIIYYQAFNDNSFVKELGFTETV